MNKANRVGGQHWKDLLSSRLFLKRDRGRFRALAFFLNIKRGNFPTIPMSAVTRHQGLALVPKAEEVTNFLLAGLMGDVLHLRASTLASQNP